MRDHSSLNEILERESLRGDGFSCQACKGSERCPEHFLFGVRVGLTLEMEPPIDYDSNTLLDFILTLEDGPFIA